MINNNPCLTLICIIRYTYPGGADTIPVYWTLPYYCFWAANLHALLSIIIGLGKASPELDYYDLLEALNPCSASIYMIFYRKFAFLDN